jgi:hypothetical protein
MQSATACTAGAEERTKLAEVLNHFRLGLLVSWRRTALQTALHPDLSTLDQPRRTAEIARQRIRRGAFKTVAELEAAINEWIACRNAEPPS